MSKKHRTVVPDFTSHKPQLRKPVTDAVNAPKPVPPPAPHVKPMATSSKSGRRGQ